MGVLEILGSALGIGMLAGIRLYATVLALGLAIRFHFYTPSKEMADLAVLADTRVLLAAGVLCLIEFLADKVPWLDSVWDSFHTFIRPVGAALLAATAFGEMHPLARTMIVLAAGTAALAGHSSKAATRLAVNHSPEPFTNLGLSFLEDAIAPAGLWLAIAHPLITLGVVVSFLALFAWLSPKIFRLLRLELNALLSSVQHWLGQSGIGAGEPDNAFARLFSSQAPPLARLPEAHRAALREMEGVDAPAGVACAATGSVRGLRQSIGYLWFGPDRAVFVTRRLFRFRTHSIPLDGQAVCYKGGILMNTLAIGDQRFDVFKAPL
jgi:uncharacterized protein DUF4126